MHTNRQSQIDAVIDVAADIEVILANIARVGTVEHIFCAVFVEPGILLRVVVNLVSIDGIQLIARQVRTVEIGCTTRTDGIEQSCLCLGVGQLVLRSIAEPVDSRKNEVEVTALVVVEADVDKRLFSFAVIYADDDTSLVERHIGLVSTQYGRGIFLRYKSERRANMVTTEKTDTGRVGSHGGDFGTQCVHCSAHSHIACRTVQVFGCYLGILVCFLCCSGHH